jgi:hypothetical protein
MTKLLSSIAATALLVAANAAIAPHATAQTTDNSTNMTAPGTTTPSGNKMHSGHAMGSRHTMGSGSSMSNTTDATAGNTSARRTHTRQMGQSSIDAREAEETERLNNEQLSKVQPQ